MIYHFFPCVLPDMGGMGGWSHKSFLILIRNKFLKTISDLIDFNVYTTQMILMFHNLHPCCFEVVSEILFLVNNFYQVSETLFLKVWVKYYFYVWGEVLGQVLTFNLSSVKNIFLSGSPNVLKSFPEQSASCSWKNESHSTHRNEKS